MGHERRAVWGASPAAAHGARTDPARRVRPSRAVRHAPFGHRERAPISACDDKVCEVRAWLSDSLRETLTTGKLLRFAYFVDPERQITLPVSLAAWIFGWAGSVGIAVLCALVWFGADLSSGHVFQNTALAVWNTMIRLVSFMAIGSALAHIRTLLNRERRITEALRRSLSEIKVLEAFLPICAQCKSIRDKEGQWQPLESYIGAHANTQFSHGYCPECARKAMDEAFGTRPDV